MNAIILAAGMGSRISKYIEEKPKCMVDIGGCTLLEYTVTLLKKKGVENITVVLGYKADYIREVMKDYKINIIYNPFFNITNGIVSMWFARDSICGDKLLIMSGDVYIEEEIFDSLMTARNNPVLLADSSRIIEADFRFNFDENNILHKYGKDLSNAETTGECVGMGLLCGDFIKKYKDHMIEMVNEQKHDVWWESVLYDMIPRENIYVHDVKGMFWAEVDYIEDYKRILKFRKEHNYF